MLKIKTRAVRGRRTEVRLISRRRLALARQADLWTLISCFVPRGINGPSFLCAFCPARLCVCLDPGTKNPIESHPVAVSRADFETFLFYVESSGVGGRDGAVFLKHCAERRLPLNWAAVRKRAAPESAVEHF